MVQTYYISAKHVQGHILFRALPHPEHRTRLYRRLTLIRTIAQRQDEHYAYNRPHHILHWFIRMSTDPHNILATTNRPFAPWAISSSRLRWTLCAVNNFVIAVAIATLRKEQTHFRTCETLCAVSNFIFAVAIATLRSEQFRYRGCDSHFAQGANSFSQLRDPLRSEQPHHRTCDSHFAPWGNPISHLQDHSHLAENQTISLCDLRMNSRPNNNTCDNLVATPQQWFSHFCSWHIVTS